MNLFHFIFFLFTSLVGVNLGQNTTNYIQSGFKTPNNNIYCLGFMDKLVDKDISYVRCDIIHRDFEDGPRPKGCEYDWGPSFSADSENKPGERACINDTIANDDYVTLKDGQDWHYGEITCKFKNNNVMCTNRHQHGFFLSKSVFKLF